MSQKLSHRPNPYLQAMGITQWRLRNAPEHVPGEDIESASEAVDSVTAGAGESVQTAPSRTSAPCSNFDWQTLQQHVAQCQQCDLHQGRRQTVFGVGNQQADWMIIGEAPGEQEDLQGEPFVGRAGLLLTNMLAAVGLQRDAVYIANVVKCRPPGNRDPGPEETSACADYLARQVELIQPKIILVVGRVAAQTLLLSDMPVGRMRGSVHYSDSRPELAGIPIVITYHPAYLLRKPSEKFKSWQDLKLAVRSIAPQVAP